MSKLDGAGYAAETVHKAHALLRMILAAAVDSDLLARSPVRGVKLPRIERREMRFLTPRGTRRAARSCPGPQPAACQDRGVHGASVRRARRVAARRCRTAAEEDHHRAPRPGRSLRAPARRGTEDPGKSEDRHDPGLARRRTRLPSPRTRHTVCVHGSSRGTAAAVGFPVPRVGARNGAGRPHRRPVSMTCATLTRPGWSKPGSIRRSFRHGSAMPRSRRL